MTRLVAVIILTCVMCVQADARLHETFEQCVARYGAPIREVSSSGGIDKSARFEKGGFVIVVSFHNDCAVSAIFLQTDKSEFLAATLNDLLRANSEGATFVRGVETESTILWNRDDGKVAGMFDKAKNAFVIWDKGFADGSEKKEKDTSTY
jgi:hypothetical protein